MNWTAENLELLRSNAGILSAPRIGELLGCSGQAVRDKLNALGIGVQRVARETTWTADQLAILREHAGKLSAPEIGRMVGRCGQSIRDKMHKLGIGGRPPCGHPWTAAEIEILKANSALMPSRELEKLIEKSSGAICSKIRELGLPGIPKGNMPVNWTPEKLEKLKLLKTGTSIKKLSKELGIGERTLGLKAKELGYNMQRCDGWRAHEDELIREMAGKVTAAEIGKQIGRSKCSVHSRANRLKINLRMDGQTKQSAPRVRDPRQRAYHAPKSKPIMVTERTVDICPLHHCPVSNWSEHKERLACAAIPPYLKAWMERAA